MMAAIEITEETPMTMPSTVSAERTLDDRSVSIAARKFSQIVKNAQNVIAMEFLSGTQALDLVLPLKPSAGVRVAYEEIRKKVPFAKNDRVFSKDIFQIQQLILSRHLLKKVEDQVGVLEI